MVENYSLVRQRRVRSRRRRRGRLGSLSGLRLNGSGPFRQHRGFEQGVGRQPVGSVHTGERHLTRGKKPVDFGTPVQINSHPAAHVVRRGNNRNGVPAGNDPVLREARRDRRKPLRESIFTDAGRIQQDELVASAFGLPVDLSGDHVAGGQRSEGMAVLHELFAGQVPEHRTFSSNGLRDQEALRLGMMKAGRMELDHFHISEGTSRPRRHRDAVRGSDVGVGRIPVDLSTAPSGEHRVLRSNQPDGSSLLVEKRHTVTPAAPSMGAYPEIEREVLLEEHDLGMLGNGSEQCTLNLLPRAILRVYDSSSAVPPLQAQI